MKTPVPMWKAKHAWQIISKVAPPKRPATARGGSFREDYWDYDAETAREQASRCVQCAVPFCRMGCPLGNRIPEWLELTAEGRFIEAAALSRVTSNMPDICARVCPQERLCEGACVLTDRSEPVAIGAVERFINEYAGGGGAAGTSSCGAQSRRVAVVGSGPGGLSCADELLQRGHHVTIFEAQSMPGGLLMHGLPAFKLEKRIVKRLLDRIRGSGALFRTGVRLGCDISLKELYSGFDAVFLATGAEQRGWAEIPGADLGGVQSAIRFLAEKNSGPSRGLEVAGRDVVVIGDGDPAVDCVRTALRCGAGTVTLISETDLSDCPASEKDSTAAVEEGAAFEFRTAVTGFEGDHQGSVKAVHCARLQRAETKGIGRVKAQRIEGSEFTLSAGIVVVAAGIGPGHVPEMSGATIEEYENRSIKIDPRQMTNIPGLFAGGDLVRGPSLVAYAVRDGRMGAAAIHDYLTS